MADNKPARKQKTLQELIDAEPDLVDRIFDYILDELPEISASVAKFKSAVRAEFAGEECYIAGRPATVRQQQVADVLALFNGRNASEVARRLNIGRTTVYRVLKQARQTKRPSFPGNGTDLPLI